MKKIIILNLLLLIFQSNFICQKSSLEKAKLAVDTLFFSDINKALELSESNIEKSLLIKDTFYIAYFLDQAGELNRKIGNYDKALDQLHKCLLYKKDWEDLKDLSLTHNNIGKTYANKGQYDLAVFYFLEALKLMEKDNNLMGQGFYLNNIAAIYDLQHNYSKALEYYQKSLEIKQSIGDSTGIAASYTNLGITYLNLADFEKALFYNQKANDMYLHLGTPSKISRTYNNMGEVYLVQKNHIKAFDYILKAYSYDSLNDDNYLRTNILNNLAHCYLQKDNLDSANYFVSIAENMALESNAHKNLKEIYALKAKIAEKSGDLMGAIAFLNKHIQYNDSLVNEANIYAVSEMAGKYEYEKNLRLISESKLDIAQKEKIIEQEKIKVFYGITLSVIFIITAIILLILYFIKQKNGQLMKGQLALIDKQNKTLENLNSNIKEQLETLQLSLEEKEQLLNNVFSKSTETELPPELLSLSKREMEVISYLALGWSDDQLAEKLFVSKSTVKTHLRRIYSKLLVRGRAEAVAIAHKYELLGESKFLN